MWCFHFKMRTYLPKVFYEDGLFIFMNKLKGVKIKFLKIDVFLNI